MADYTELLKIIKETAKNTIDSGNPTGIFFGTVLSADPLSIQVEQRLILNQNQLILSRNVTDYKTKISFDNGSIEQPFTTKPYNGGSESTIQKIMFKEKTKHDITVYNALQANDTVILLQMQGGQKFIVIDRVGG